MRVESVNRSPATGVTVMVAVVARRPTGNRTAAKPAVIELKRTGGGLRHELTVYLSFSGTAVAGTDYKTPPSRAIFASGAATTIVHVQPLPRAISGTVQISIVTGPGYVADPTAKVAKVRLRGI